MVLAVAGRTAMAATQLPDAPSRFTRQALIVLGLVVLALLLWKVMPVLMLFFAGVVIAAAVRAGAMPIASRLHIRDVWAVGIVGVLALALLIGGGYLFGHQ